MLRALRNQTKSIFFKGFLLLLILGFALWGVGDLTGGYNKKPILKVGKKEITSEEIINELNRLRYTMPQRPTLQEAIKNGMLKTVLDKYEQEILINAEAEALSLYVPLKIQTSTIRKEGAFKDPLGKFSKSRFLRSLNSAGLSENKYLDSINTEANFKQLSMPFSYNSVYSDKLISKIIDWQNEVRDLDYIFLKRINKNIIKKPTKNILKKYYNDNKNSYKVPITRNIKYIEIKPSDFNNQVQIDESKIKEIYESKITEFTTEEKREVYQVITQDLEKANIFVEKIKNGNNFVNVAKDQFKLTLNDIKIGFINKSELPLNVADNVFQGNVNDIIGPIKTKFGYSSYKIISIKPKKIISYKEAYPNIKKDLTNELTLEILYEKINFIEDLLAEGNNLNEIFQSKHIEKKGSIEEIKNISKNGIIYSFNKTNKYFNKDNAFLERIWNTSLNELSDIIELPNDTYVLFEMIKENKEEIPIFEKINKTVAKEWMKKERNIQTELKLKKLLNNKKTKFISLSNIKRDQKQLSKLVIDPLIINKVFEIKDKNINFFNTSNGTVGIKINNTKTAKYKINNETKNSINLSLSKSFFNDYSQSYLDILSIKHKLKRNYKNLENFITSLENN